jgi:hypothetical protein
MKWIMSVNKYGALGKNAKKTINPNHHDALRPTGVRANQILKGIISNKGINNTGFTTVCAIINLATVLK